MAEETPLAEVKDKPAETEPDQDPEPDELAVSKDGQKVVPLPDLIKSREKARTYKSEAEALKAQLEEAKTLAQFGQQSKPIIEALKNRPDIVQQLMGNAPASEPGPVAPEDEDLVMLAQSIDLYDASGKPDVKRAKTIRSLIDKGIDSKVNDVVTPLRDQTKNDKAAQNYQWMLSQQTPEGTPVKKEIIDGLFSKMSREDQANPEYVANVMLMAYGTQKWQEAASKSKVRPPDSEPVATGASGGRGSRVVLTDQLKRVAQDIGLSQKEAQTNLERIMANDGVLEDV